jgi:hypothetical protein
MSNEQKALLEMNPGDVVRINGHEVMKQGGAWIIDGSRTHFDISLAAHAVGRVGCPCGNSESPGHPVNGYCARGIGGVRL